MDQENTVSPDVDTQIPTPATSETPEVVTPESVETTEQQTDAPPAESEADKALKRMQRRIDKRTADVYRERAEKDQLAQRIAQLEARSQQGEQQPANHDDAIRATARTLAQEMAQQQKVADTIGGVLKAGKALPEFDKACNAVAEELPFYEASGKPSPFLAAVLEFDNPAQLLHHLGTNPDLAAELADLTPTRQIRRLDAIEREMTEKAKPKTSAAPKPLAPVKGAGNSQSGPSDSDSTEVWLRKEAARLNQKLGRTP